jgi:hypothetical protein
MNYKKLLKLNIMKRKFLMKAFVCLFTVVALCSCSENEDRDEKKDEPKSAACEIVSFVVNDTVWNIDGTNIAYEYPPARPKTPLTPTITLSPGATVNPPTTEAKDFFTEQGVTYTVTAEDGETTKTYTVKATVQVGDDEQSVISNPLIVVVENGNNYNDINVVKLEVGYPDENGQYAEAMLTSASYINGRFTLNLPENVDAKYLMSVTYMDRYDFIDFTVSNRDAKLRASQLNAYKSNSKIGFFYHGTEEWAGVLVYFDSDCNLTGSYTEILNEITYKCSYNVRGKKGWNMMYSKETEKGDNSYEEEITDQVPAGAKWYFYRD